MLNLYSTDSLDVHRYYDLLCEKGFIYVNMEKLNDDVTFLESRVSSLAANTIRHMQVTQRKLVTNLSDENIYEYLVDGCGVSPSSFRAKNVRGWSIDASKLNRLSDRKMVADFLDFYSAFKSTKTKKGIIAGIQDRAEQTEEVNRSGARLGKVKFQVEPRQNLRFYYKKESIVQIPKTMSSSVTVPEGYFLVWGDFASADMIAALNCYILESERDKEIAQMHGRDGYAIFAHLISEFYGEKFDQEEFLENRAAYKLYALKTIYGNTYGASEEENLFIKRALPFLRSRPRYMQYVKNIKQAYEMGLPIEIESYFGPKQLLDRTPENSSLTEVTDKALNTPIQTHTSERIIALVLAVVDRFAGEGYVYGEDFWVYYIRHDEPLFIFKERVLQDIWILEDNAAIVVDDGITQYVDWIYGYDYKVPDSNLQERVDGVCERNRDRLTPPKPKKRKKAYLPLAEVLTTGVFMRDLGEDLVAAVYVENNNTVAYKKYVGLGCASASQKLDVLQDLYLQKLQKEKIPGVQNIMAFNELTGDPLYQDGIYYLMKREYGSALLKARALCEWTCERIAMRDGLPFEKRQDFDDRALADLRRVGTSDVFI